MDALLTTFVEGIGYLKLNPSRKAICFTLMRELISQIREKALSMDSLLVCHVDDIERSLHLLEEEMTEENFGLLRRFALKLQNDLLRI